MTKAYISLLILLLPLLFFGQQPDTLPGTDSAFLKKDSSLLLKDSIQGKPDSSTSKIVPVQLTPREKYTSVLDSILKHHKYLNTSSAPAVMLNKVKGGSSEGLIFYILLVAVGLLAFFRFVYQRYFNNLFRVFFNTSLRQSQLTDQLLQAKQPSMFFNLLFIIIGGVYIYLLLLYYQWLPGDAALTAIGSCIGGLLLIYMLKYIVLKFTGWVTGFTPAVNTYIFVVFLINKILGVLLVPFVIIMAFSDHLLKTSAVIISLLLVGLMFLLRFFRSFGLLQHQLKVSRFHFFLYIAGVEILPLLLIYKGVLVLLSKKL
ncbi:MAG: DUF4271 domain-containing protein [Ferruginibacter sp.]